MMGAAGMLPALCISRFTIVMPTHGGKMTRSVYRRLTRRFVGDWLTGTTLLVLFNHF